MVWYGMLWYTMVCYGMLWYGMKLDMIGDEQGGFECDRGSVNQVFALLVCLPVGLKEM